MKDYETIKKILGQIKPVGETYEDSARATNLDNTISLVKLLLDDIRDVAKGKDRIEWSIKTAGKTADKFINELTALE